MCEENSKQFWEASFGEWKPKAQTFQTMGTEISKIETDMLGQLMIYITLQARLTCKSKRFDPELEMKRTTEHNSRNHYWNYFLGELPVQT